MGRAFPQSPRVWVATNRLDRYQPTRAGRDPDSRHPAPERAAAAVVAPFLRSRRGAGLAVGPILEWSRVPYHESYR